MATNYNSEGKVIDVLAPTGGVASGDTILLGGALGVCLNDAVAGAALRLGIVGNYTLPAAAADTIAAGDALYWDAGNTCVTVVATGNSLCGIACEAKATAVVLCATRLAGYPVV